MVAVVLRAVVLSTLLLLVGGPAASAGTTGAGRPVAPVPGAVLRTFSPPASPYGPGHRGVDLAAAPGSAVRAALAGTVTFAGQVAGRGWVTVAHGGGLDTTYGWLEPRAVRTGQRVRTGQVLGRLAADAGHLDWGARRDGAYFDPLSLLGPWRARLAPAAGGRPASRVRRPGPRERVRVGRDELQQRPRGGDPRAAGRPAHAARGGAGAGRGPGRRLAGPG